MSVSVKTTLQNIVHGENVRTSVALLDKSGKVVEEIDLNGGFPEKKQAYSIAIRLYLSSSVLQNRGEVEEINVVYNNGALKIIVDEEFIRVAVSTGYTVLI